MGMGQDHDKKPTETADQACGSLLTLERQLGSLYGTEFGPWHECDSCEVWSFVESLAVGPGAVPDT